MTGTIHSTPTELAAPRARPRLPRKALVGLAIVAVYVLAALFAGVITRSSPLEQDLLNRLDSPSGDHLLGTDALGRDVMTRLIHSVRVDLRVAVIATVLAVAIGSLLGTVAGFFGGIVDTIVMRLADLVLAFPVLVLFLAVLGAIGPGQGWWFLGPGEPPVIIVAAGVGWVVYARLVRGEILRIRQLDYVLAARAGGLSERRVLLRHVLPNALNQTIVYVVVDVGLVVLALASLSFLGLGIPIPIAEWGAMIADGKPYLATHWWLVVAPGLAIGALGIGLALIGDSLDDRLKGS
jgi:peptide/nickel transport system permease protein